MGNVLGTTLLSNEQAILYSRNGDGRVIAGPALVRLGVGQRLVFMARYLANEKDYLQINFLDGHTEHRAGPCTVFLNEIEHSSVHVCKAIDLSANEVLVVYRKKSITDGGEDKGQVERTLIYGPAMHVPRSDEWHHEFVWHGSIDGNKTVKAPGATRFHKLRVIPDQFYYNVRDVRTKDEAVIVVKIMIFFELKDIIKMLESTHDPIADFINAASADVISFVSHLNYEEFMEESKALNDLSAWPQLVRRSSGIGYHVTKVVFRGYQASDALQAMNNESIAARTRLRLNLETEQQAQQLADLKLKREGERAAHSQRMEAEQRRHELALEREAFEAQLKRRADEAAKEEEAARRRNDEALRFRQASDEAEARKQSGQNDIARAHLEALAKMKVDLTQYLIAQCRAPDKLVRIERSDGAQGGDATAVHLHDA